MSPYTCLIFFDSAANETVSTRHDINIFEAQVKYQVKDVKGKKNVRRDHCEFAVLWCAREKVLCRKNVHVSASSTAPLGNCI